MALIISIELNNATFEDLATLVSTAGAAGANDSTTIEFDDEQQVLRVIIEDPIAPDIDTTDPNFFTLFDDELGDVDEDFDEGFDLNFDDPRAPDGHGHDDHGAYGSQRGRHAGGSQPFDISTAINDFIDNLADEFPLGRLRGNPRAGRGSERRAPQGFPPVDFLYGLAEEYFRDFGYRSKFRGTDEDNDGVYGNNRSGQHRDDPIQDDFYSDEPDSEDLWGKGNPFGPGARNDFQGLRNAGEGFLKGLSDFINEQVDRRAENGGGNRGDNRGRGPAQGYGSFTDPNAETEHSEGTSHDDEETEEKLRGLRDFPGFSYLDENDIEDLSTPKEHESGAHDGDGEYSPGDDNHGAGNSRDDRREKEPDDEDDS